MPIFESPHALRDDPFIDCNEPEAFTLEDILHDVRALGTVPDMLPFSFATDYDVVVWAMATLCESPLARSFAFDARFEDWAIELDECEDGRHIIDGQMRVLIVPRFVPSAVALGRSPYFRYMFLAELCRGLRAIWHQDTGVRHGWDLTIPQQLQWNRLRQADHDLMALIMAWEVREAGFPELWRHMIGSDLGDLAVAFSATLERNPAGIDLPAVLRKLFLQWMEHDPFLNSVDHRTLARLDDYISSPGSGRPYGGDRLSVSDVMRLASLPEESGYLDALARHILSDEYFARMPDLINETHFQHILRDLTAQRIAAAGFHDKELARRIFPDNLPESVDTLA